MDRPLIESLNTRSFIFLLVILTTLLLGLWNEQQSSPFDLKGIEIGDESPLYWVVLWLLGSESMRERKFRLRSQYITRKSLFYCNQLRIGVLHCEELKT